ncbi:MAG: D-alanyl-D-alanine carboxypeptidase/D-alanyl-D-alanine-endopeptidase [Gemmatimonadota bacterium]
MMKTARRWLAAPLLLGSLGACAPALGGAGPGALTPLGSEIDSIFDDPEFAHAHWGVLFRSLETGETIYSRNAERLFLPASNMKLITGAAGLETLGPEYRYRTTISMGGPIADGAVDGPLIVTGTGDPTFSGRFLEDPREIFRAWADSLRAQGVTRIAGGVIGVDTAFSDPTLGQGWMWDDLAGSSSAEFGALQFNHGIVRLEIFPSQTVLQPAVVVLDPPTQFVRIINDTRTMPAGSETNLRVTRDDAGSAIIIRGEIAADDDGFGRTVAIRNPALYLASIVRETLRESGISVEGPAIHYPAVGIDAPMIREAVPLFYHYSPPLREILAGMMKPSQNQIAETLLRTVGREARGDGSASAAREVIDSLFVAWEFEHTRARIADGSGLSRYDHLSPALLVELLERMDRSTLREDWIASLPIAGRDGTLESRMEEPPLVEQVRAKTGTLSGVRALSGYLTTQSGERIAFSTMVNGSLLGSSAADRVVEAALERIAVSR